MGVAVESSCDETGVAVVSESNELLSNPLFSQIELHKEYGGVVPEIASREHMAKLPLLMKEAISVACQKLNIDDKELLTRVKFIAVTVRPGLVGSLLVGYNGALVLKDMLQVPLIPVHHLEAHLYAVILEGKSIQYPFLGVLLSGGNTILLQVDGLANIKILGNTMDDACGEALDKAASLLGLPYPGGPYMEKAANKFLDHVAKNNLEIGVIDKANPLPKVLANQKKTIFAFSYSGLKTALLYKIKKINSIGQLENIEQAKDILNSVEALAYYFQQRLFEIVNRNISNILKHDSRFKQVIMAGGVAANQTLKKKLANTIEKYDIAFDVPSPKYCTDNAAMIAITALQYYRNGTWPTINKVTSQNDFFSVKKI